MHHIVLLHIAFLEEPLLINEILKTVAALQDMAVAHKASIRLELLVRRIFL